jgi:hypothetical protein
MHRLLEELAAGVGSGALSEIQFHIVMDRATNWTAWTYARLIPITTLADQTHSPTPSFEHFVGGSGHPGCQEEEIHISGSLICRNSASKRSNGARNLTASQYTIPSLWQRH